jgi:hypothetical protein
MVTTYPPSPVIVVPMLRNFAACADPDFVCTPITHEVRRFKLHDFTNRGPIASTALYREEE